MDECYSKVCAKGPELTRKAGPLVIRQETNAYDDVRPSSWGASIGA